MRRVSLLLGTLLIVSLLLAACGGEQTSTSVPSTNVPPITSEATVTGESTEEATATADAGDMTTTPGVPVTGENDTSRLSNLLDFDVWNQNGEQIGEVEDMVLDADNTNISYVVIETGGFLDIGDKTVLIPWNSLELQLQADGAQENAFVLTSDPEMLNNAPDMDLQSMLPERGEAANDWDADVRSFWEGGVMPEATGEATQAGDATAMPEATGEATESPEMTATTDAGAGTGQGQNAQQLQGVMLASELIGSTITIGNQGGTGTGMGEATAMPEATTDPNAPAAPEATTDPNADAQATPTIDGGTGAGTVTGTQGPTDAVIEDVIIDPDTGDILFFVLNALFDDGERLVPVPLSTLRWDMTNQSLMMMSNNNAIQNAPFFQSDQWPDTSTDGWDSEFDTFWQNSGGTGTSDGTINIATATPSQ